MFVDRQSNLWVSIPDGLFRYDGRTWQIVSSPPLGWISTMTTAPDGRLWFVGSRGVAVYDSQGNQP